MENLLSNLVLRLDKPAQNDAEMLCIRAFFIRECDH
jgi:hypothetical protein